MKLADLYIAGGWKTALIKVALMIVFVVGCWWGWREYWQSKEQASNLNERQAVIEQRYEALQVRIQESQKRTERRLETVAIQAQEYASQSDITVLVDDLNDELERWRRDSLRSSD